MAETAVRSKAVALLFLIFFNVLPIVCVSFVFVFALLCIILRPFIFTNILKMKRKLVALLLLSYRCIVTINVLWLFLTVPWIGLQCAIVVFPDHTHLLLNIEFECNCIPMLCIISIYINLAICTKHVL